MLGFTNPCMPAIQATIAGPKDAREVSNNASTEKTDPRISGSNNSAKIGLFVEYEVHVIMNPVIPPIRMYHPIESVLIGIAKKRIAIMGMPEKTEIWATMMRPLFGLHFAARS